MKKVGSGLSKADKASLLNELGITEKVTRLTDSVKKPKYFTKTRDNVPLVKNYNQMCDLLFLPETKEGYKYLLTIVDIASRQFDMEPLRTKEPEEALEALKKIYRRPYIKEPYASLQTDDGNEFKSVFDQYLYDKNIYHKTARTSRHSQMGMIEALNKELGYYINNYMNAIEVKTGKVNREWISILPKLREKLNKGRETELPANWRTHQYKTFQIPINQQPKYKVGDLVYIKNEKPQNALNQEVHGTFRMGDFRYKPVPKAIKKVLYYTGKVMFRYLVGDEKNVSFTENDLIEADKEDTQEKYTVKQIIGKRTNKKKLEYLVWWNKYKKAESTWEPQTILVEDLGINVFNQLVADYEASLKKKQ